MKLALVLALFCTSVFATPAPYSKDENNRFKAIESKDAVTTALENLSKANGFVNATVAKFQIEDSVASISGATVSTGIVIPANSIINDAWFFFDETNVSGSANTVGVTCNSVSDNITLLVASSFLTGQGMTADSVTDSYKAAITTRSVVSANGCTINQKVGTGATGITGMDIKGFVDYNVVK